MNLSAGFLSSSIFSCIFFWQDQSKTYDNELTRKTGDKKMHPFTVIVFLIEATTTR